MLGMRLNYELGMKELAIGRRLKRMLGTFPPHIWETIKAELVVMSTQRASHIKTHRVKPSTHKIRQSYKKRGLGVQTYSGQTAVPVGGWKVGNRTGTFLHDYSTGSPPGVITEIGKEERVENGFFNYEIDVNAFHDQYPYTFNDYLFERGIIPSGGLLDFGSDAENLFLDKLEQNVWVELKKKFGKNLQ